MNLRHTILIFSSTLLSACYIQPNSPDNLAYTHTRSAKAFFKAGDCKGAAKDINKAVLYKDGGERVLDLFEGQPEIRQCYISYMKGKIQSATRINRLRTLKNQLEEAKRDSILPYKTITELNALLEDRVAHGNHTDLLKFDFSEYLFTPQLSEPDHQKIIARRTLEKLKLNNQKRPGNQALIKLLKYVEVTGSDSDIGHELKALFPSLNPNKQELKAATKTFPELAQKMMANNTADVSLRIINGDRLLEADIHDAINRRIKGLSWQKTNDKSSMTIEIEQLRFTERELAEKTDTIRYARHEVDLINATLSMPNYSSYLYDVVTSSRSIEYAFAITVKQGNTIVYDKLLRGEKKSHASRCENARIQNAFGGTSNANFTANQSMKSQCIASKSSSMAKLRQKVYEQIGFDLLNVPTFKRVNSLN